MRHKNILLIISLILIFEGLLFLLCIPYAVCYSEPVKPFYIPAFFSLVAGLILFFASGKKFVTIPDNKGSINLIAISWFIMILTGTLPYLISETIPSLVDVLFETISGFTTTGTTILPDIAQMPKSILFWRSLTHWFGGLATIVMVITVFPLLNVGGNELFSLESLSEEKPVHKLRFVIIRVFIIYLGLTVIQVLFLYLGGMNLFKSLCYSFGTVSTGCFSPENGNVAIYSGYIQYIMVLFMFLSGISYLIYFIVINGKYRIARDNEEVRVYALIILFATIFISGILHLQTGKGIGIAFREGIFHVVSFVSSSGYFVTKYLSWPDYTLPLLYLLMAIGGCVSSASGGIKMSRFLVLFKNFRQQFKNPNSDTNISSIKYNRKNIDENTNLSILTFISVFGVVFVFGTIVLSLFVTDLKKTVFLAISALSNFGYNQNLSGFPDTGKAVLSLMMLVGRLEIFPVLLLFFPSFYKTNNSINLRNQDEER